MPFAASSTQTGLRGPNYLHSPALLSASVHICLLGVFMLLLVLVLVFLFLFLFLFFSLLSLFLFLFFSLFSFFFTPQAAYGSCWQDHGFTEELCNLLDSELSKLRASLPKVCLADPVRWPLHSLHV
jgi:hypothetical protein